MRLWKQDSSLVYSESTGETWNIKIECREETSVRERSPRKSTRNFLCLAPMRCHPMKACSSIISSKTIMSRLTQIELTLDKRKGRGQWMITVRTQSWIFQAVTLRWMGDKTQPKILHWDSVQPIKKLIYLKLKKYLIHPSSSNLQEEEGRLLCSTNRRTKVNEL